jgi:glucosamine-6-phosphate deaminase
MYAHLARLCAAEVVSFRHVTTFNLDEYVGLPTSDAGSYRAYMERHFIEQVDVRTERVHVPRSSHGDPEVECRAYEDAIRRAGGWALAVLGLGRNGHIAFNEPGTAPDARTHVATLTASTRAANRADFAGRRVTPERAMTVGLGTILQARSIVLLATGEGKAGALARLASQAVDTSVPVTLLNGHRDVVVVADRALRADDGQTPA